MPFVANQSDEEERKDQPQGAVAPGGQGGGAVRLAPSAAVAPGGTGGPASSPASSGGQFASLNQYLTANAGRAEPLAGKITSDIGKQYQGLEGQNQQALSNIGGQVAAQPDYSKASDVVAQEAANPASFTSNPANVESFQNLLRATYAGPASAEGTSEYANQQAAINKAISQGQASTQTEAGRENLIAASEAKPGTGVTALNSAILSKSPEAFASVENAYKPFQNLLTGLQGGAAEQNKAIAARQAQAAEAKRASTEALTSQMSGLNTDVNARVAAAQKGLADQNAKIKTELASGNPSDQTLAAIGTTRDQWNSLTAAQKAAATPQQVMSNRGQYSAETGTANINLTDFLNQTNPSAVVNAANVATPEDYARAKAFQSLVSGIDLATPSMVVNPASAAQAGTAPTKLSNFDYQTALGVANQAKADEVASAKAYAEALQGGADEAHAQQAAKEAARQTKEQLAEAMTGVGLPVAIASNLPVIGKPISKAVDTVVQTITGGTWVCTAMREANVMTADEVRELHDLLFPAFRTAPLRFLGYFMLGPLAVRLAKTVKIDWREWKMLFYTAVVRTTTRADAVEAYERAFWKLVGASMSKLWQGAAS